MQRCRREGLREKQLKKKLKTDRLVYKATALDKSANLSAGQSVKGGSLSSADKVSTNSSDAQAKSGKGARHSLQGGRAIADKYEKRVNTKGVGGAMHLSKFNAQEAFQDEQLALKED